MLRAAWAPAAIGETFHLGSGVETRIVDLAEKINELTGNEAGISFGPRRTWDTKTRRRAAIDRARELIGFSPGVSLDAGLEVTHRWFRASFDEIRQRASFPPGSSAAAPGVVTEAATR